MTKSCKSPSSFSPIADVLKAQIKQLSNGALDPLINLQKKWPDLVGKVIAKQSDVLYIKNKILHVSVKNSTWHQELMFMKPEIKTKLGQLCPNVDVVDVKFKVTS